MREFKSVFAGEINEYLELRKSVLGKDAYAHDVCYLSRFDARIVELGVYERTISEETITAWLRSLSGKRGTVANEAISVRLFLKHLRGLGVDAFLPPVPRDYDDYVPYVFADGEIERIFSLADNMPLTASQPNPKVRREFPMLLRLMYGCGLRVGETLVLRMRDVDLEGGILVLTRTKDDKQRIVPMHEELTRALGGYCGSMGLIGNADAFLFPGHKPGTTLSVAAARGQFNQILKRCGIVPAEREKHERGPCLHCLRHVFVFKYFSRASASGLGVDESAPFLSTYLGHDGLRETEKYMKFGSELFPDSTRLFERFASAIFSEVDDGE
jgi:integrase